MFQDIKEIILEYVKHRLFVVTLIFIGLFIVLINRLFTLQIVEGEEHLQNFTYKIKREISISASRGDIYDRNGNLLAYNQLSYNVTFENTNELSDLADQKDMTDNQLKNEIIYSVITKLESNGDSMIYDFPIVLSNSGDFQYNISDTALLNFIKEVYSVTSVEKLSDEQKNATAEDIFNFLRHGTSTKNKMFDISDDYTNEEALKIMAIRYSIWLNRFKQFVPVEIAENISDESMAFINENTTTLPGISVETSSIRVYNYPEYFSHIIGYTGNINTDELEEYNADLVEENQYSSDDIVGKTGIEKEMESYLRGDNGLAVLYVDQLGKILETVEQTDASAGNDVYLTIDLELQKYCYNALEKEISGIILAHMTPTSSTGNENNILIPAADVYFALYNNNTLSIENLKLESASDNEKQVYSSYLSYQDQTIAQIRADLESHNIPTKNLSEEYQDYNAYIYAMLRANGILDRTNISDSDEMYQSYVKDNISLGEFLQYAITNKSINISSFNISSDYYDTDEVYAALIDYVISNISESNDFDKLLFKYMIQSGIISGYQACTMLYDQGILDESDEDYALLTQNGISSYEFIRRKISNLEITPAQLALDPCSGTCIVEDPNNGEILAMVSYPSYDNNKLANSIDVEYFNKLNNDLTSPLYNRATQQRTAPGSTFKMITSVAGVQEGVINVSSIIEDEGVFSKVTPSPKCWIAPGNHGDVDMERALEVSCNYYYYEVGFMLSKDSNGDYNDKLGIERLTKYANMFGLGDVSGIELPEASPKVSTESAVASSIGQGSNSYTPTQLSKYVSAVANNGTCYNLSVVKEVQDIDGNIIYETQHTISGTIQLPDSLWNAIHNGMRRVITNNTAETSLLNQMDVAVAGKTGTAQEDKTRANHALFLSYAPFDDPQIAVTAIIPFGHSSGNAEELASFIYAYYYQPDLLEDSTVQANTIHTD